MDGGGPKPKLCAHWGTWSNVNTIIDRVRSIPRAVFSGDKGLKLMSRVAVFSRDRAPQSAQSWGLEPPSFMCARDYVLFLWCWASKNERENDFMCKVYTAN